jgi:hypothetical protein
VSLSPPSQRTWSVGDIVTAAEMNANVRDSVNFLAAVPLFIALQQTAQSIANASGGGTPLNFADVSGVIVDSYNGHSTSSNPSRYAAQVAGWYKVEGRSGWVPSGTGLRIAGTSVNGTVQKYGTAAPVAGSNWIASVSDILFLNVGDYVEVLGYQTSGAALNTNNGVGYQSSIMVRWIHS